MKQVTMESVKERIARIESGAAAIKPGGMELSLQHEFELACLRELVAVTEQRDAVVAESLVLNAAAKKVIKMNRQHAKDQHGNPDIAESWACVKVLREARKTPATDAAIAALRAEGVEMAIETAKPFIASEYQYSDFEACVSASFKYPESDLFGKVEMVEWLEDFARQLRESKGAQS
ncbi:hypothetical protein KXR87_13135 [Yokenella regensburgei]|uniref:hypothetical protein n=1 Tax=Yokenella regensburgei TaxID=158877 RepID=UPI003F18BF2B